MTAEPSADQREDLHMSPGLAEEVAAFLYREAELLDELRFDAWLELFTKDATYLLPSTDVPGSDPATHLFVINDDYPRLAGRVQRLQSRDAHADYPHPRTRRLVTNVRAEETVDGLVARANFLVLAYRVGQRHDFAGQYTYQLRRHGESFLISSRRADLDLELLGQAGGKVNIIV